MIIGPIASGKSSLAEALAGRLRAAGRTVAVLLRHYVVVSGGGVVNGLPGLVAARDRWLQEARQRFAADDRVVAAWLSGSMGRGVGDEWADLDIHLVVADEWSEEVLAVPVAAEAFGDLVFWVDCSQNAPLHGMQVLTRFLVDGQLVMVDLNVWPESFAVKFSGCRDLIDPRGRSILTTDESSHEIMANAERRDAPRYSREQKAAWLACMIHIATAFPPRGHDATAMLALIGADESPDRSPRSQLQALEERLNSLQPLLTPRAFAASLQRLRLAERHLPR